MQPASQIGPYKVERRLATGGMAEVVVARRVGPHGFTKRVALKRILPQYAQDAEFVAMFVSEAKLCSQMSHPNIVQVFDFGETNNELFLAMELVEGTTVNRLLRAISAVKERVPVDVALHIVTETARALAYAHQMCDAEGKPLGFVHRDVSPANVLLTQLGHVKLTDFGIARIAESERRTDDGHVRGKLGYMSPEQVLGLELDGRSDVFTLTTVFAEMLLGQPLFGYGSDIDILVRIRDANLSEVEAKLEALPRDVARLIRHGLARRPEERPPGHIFADACERLCRRHAVLHGPERLARLLAELKLISERALLNVPDSAEVLGVGEQEEHRDTSTREMMRRLGVTSPKEYRVRTAEGEVRGPVSFPKLVQWVTSGKLSESCRVSKGPGAYLPLAEHRELERFARSAALRWQSRHSRPPHRSGEALRGDLIRELFELWRTRRTGMLLLERGEVRKKIYLVNGTPEFIASTDEKELLGEYLVSQGLCLQMEVEMALALLPRYGGRLGDALVGLGVLRPIQLFRAIAGQIRARFIDVFRWREGSWAFYDQERSDEECFPLGYDALELILDGVAEIPDVVIAETLHARARERFMSKWLLDPVLSQVVETYALQALLDAFREQATVQEVAERLLAQDQTELEVLKRQLFVMLTFGFLTPHASTVMQHGGVDERQDEHSGFVSLKPQALAAGRGSRFPRGA